MFLRKSNRSTALKTLALRLRGAKTELEEAGEDVDGMAESTSQLQAKLNALTHGKVDIMLDADTFKSTTQILREMSAAWEDMTDIERAAALELMGGKRQANILSSVITNFETVEDVIETSMNSSGSAIAENEKWLDSIEGKTYQFTNALQTMWSNMLDSETLKGFIDFGTEAIQFLDTGAGKVIALVAALKLMAKFKGFSIGGIVQGLGDTIKNITQAKQTLDALSSVAPVAGPLSTESINAYAQAVAGLTAKQQANLLASQNLTKQDIQRVLQTNKCTEAEMREAMAHVHTTATKEQEAAASQQILASKTQEAVASYRAQAAKLMEAGATETDTAVSEANAAANFLEANAANGVTLAKVKEAVASGTISAATGQEIIAKLGLTDANWSLKASNDALKASNPYGWVIIAISALIVLIQTLSKSSDKMKRLADEAINKQKEMQNTLSSNKETINDLKDDYQTLASGVDEFGNNISLTTSEYERYNEIVNKIADMFPEMVRGYTEEGNAIIKNKGNVEQLTEAYKALQDQANNALINSGESIMKNYKATINGSFGSTDNSTSESIAASNLLKKILREQDTFDFEEFGREYRDPEYDTILGLLGDAGISRIGSETNAAYVKRAISEFPGIVQSIINSWDAVVASAVSNVKPLVSAYLDTSIGYASLTKEQQSVFDSIASSFDSDFFNQFDGDVSRMYQTIENMVLNLKESGIDEEYTLVLNAKTQFNNNEISVGDYQKQIQGFIDQIDDLYQKGFLGEDDVKYIKMSLGFKFDDNGNIQSDIDTIINHIQKITNHAFDDKILTLSYSDLQIINSDKFNVDGSTIYTWQQLQQEIKDAKILMTEDFTTDSFANYADQVSKISSNLSTYQEALDKLEDGTFTLTDFMDLISQYPDLADGVDLASGSFNGLAKNLKRVSRNAPDDLVDELKELREQLELAGKSTVYIDQLINSIEDMPVDIIASLSDEYVTLTDTINEATAAQNELKEAMSENPNEGYETRGDAIEQMKTLMEEGKIGSESELWSIAEAFGFTYDSAKTINENADALAKFIAARQQWYAQDEDGNYTYDGTENFLNDVEKVVASNEKLQQMGVKWNYNDQTGALDFDFNNADWDMVVEILGESKELAGLTSEEFYDLLMQVGQFFDINWQDANDLIYYLQQINRGAESAAEQFDTTKSAITSFLESNGYSVDLLELTVDDTEFKQLPEDIQKVLAEYYEIKKKVEEDPLGINWQLNKNIGAPLQNTAKTLTEDSIKSLSQLTTIMKDNESGTVFIDYTNLENAAKEAGYTEEAIDDMIAKIKECRNVFGVTSSQKDPLGLTNLQADAQQTEQYLNALQFKFETIKNSDNTISYKIDVESVVDALMAQGWTTEKIQGYLTTLEESGHYSFTLDGAEINISDTDARNKINDLIQSKETLSTGEVTEYTVTGTGEASVDHIKSVWNNIPTTKSTTYTIYEKHKEDTSGKGTYKGIPGNGIVGVDGTAHVQGTAHATGSWGAPKTETALVGELGPEMLVRNGRWTTIGDNGAEFTQVKKGDIIFNHKQTQDLLSKGYVTGRGKLHGGAFASGTAYPIGSGNFASYDIDGGGYTEYDVNDNVVERFKDTSSSISRAANSLSSASDNVSDSADEFREVFDWIEVRLEEINESINLRSAELENQIGYQNQNKTVDKIIDLNQKLYDNLIAGSNRYYSYAEKLLTKVPEEYRKAAQDGTIAIEEFVGEADQKTLEAIQEYREWVQKGDEAAQRAEETLTEISNLAKQAIDNIAQDYDNKRSFRDNKIDQYEAYNEFLETDKGFESTSIYEAMIKENNKIIDGLKQQRDKMQAELNKRVESGEIKVGSQNWYDAVNDIAAVDTEIIELKTDTENYQDTINELHWDKFDALMKRLEVVSDEADNLIDILGNKDLVDESGNWTDEGITSLGLYAQQMEAAEVQAKKYEEEIDYLNKNWKKLGYTEEEYIEKLDELKSGQYDAIQAYHDSKDAIVDLNKERIDAIKEGIEKEIEAYEELIEKKKEELDAEKDLYDFQKSVMEQEKDIADLERQLASLSADNSASARAKRAQLEAELAEAQAALQESYYDRSISNQQEALDKELENFQEEKDAEIEGWDEYLENTEQVVADSLETIQTNTDAVYQTLLQMGQEYGLSITESLTSPWTEGSNAIQAFSEQFGISMSATVEELLALELQFKETMLEIEQAGINAANTVKKNAESYTSAEYQEPKDDAGGSGSGGGNSGGNGGSANAGLVSSLSGYIQYGNTGDKVKKLQKALNDLGYGNSGTTGLDGIFGDKTLAAVRQFQKDMGVAVDGIVGPETKKKFKAKGYAKGSKGLNKDQWALIDELGDELLVRAQNGRLTYMEKGTGIVPADLTSNLMGWGKLDPRIMIDQNRPSVGVHPEISHTEIQIDNSIAELIHIDHCDQSTLPDVEKIVNNALEKHTQRLNQSLRKYTR